MHERGAEITPRLPLARQRRYDRPPQQLPHEEGPTQDAVGGTSKALHRRQQRPKQAPQRNKKQRKKRLTPIMLTSLTTVFGLIPMAMAGGALFEPMATLMIGGLAVASVVTLLFVPCGYYLLFLRSEKSVASGEHEPVEDVISELTEEPGAAS